MFIELWVYYLITYKVCSEHDDGIGKVEVFSNTFCTSVVGWWSGGLLAKYVVYKQGHGITDVNKYMHLQIKIWIVL